jgi:hypothetical protein
MIFLKAVWPGGSITVCGSFWPGAGDGAPPPPGWPDDWLVVEPIGGGGWRTRPRRPTDGATVHEGAGDD